MQSLSRIVRSPVKNYRKYRSLYDISDLDFDNVDDNSNPNVLWALRNVSFEVTQGEMFQFSQGELRSKRRSPGGQGEIDIQTESYATVRLNLVQNVSAICSDHHSSWWSIS